MTTVEKVPGDFQVVHAELGTIQSTSGAGLEKAERNAQRGVRRSGPDVVRGVVATDQ